MKKHVSILGFNLLVRVAVSLVICLQTIPIVNAAPQFMEFFTATPIIGSLSSTCWGAAEVGPRDQSNGLEDITLAEYCYWDGAIIKDPDGVYHMFASRWDESAGHKGWVDSLAVHATSNNLYGPYIDQGLVWPDDEGGKGHNVLALVLHDGRYVVYASETRRPTEVYVSDNLNGPWSHMGNVSIASNSYSSGFTHSNVFIMLRPDGRYGIISRNALVGIADNILGPYTIQGPNIYSQAAGMPTSKVEDPCMWYSGGQYHVIANKFDARKAYHLTSKDGMTNWKLEQGYAYDPTADFLRYTDGTVNHWYKLERFNVYIENDHVAAVILSAIDVAKGSEKGNDQHGSKVLVVPFDGARFDEGQQTPAPTPEVTPGDANGDETVDIVDALFIAQHYVGLNPTGFIAANADVDCSGTIDIVDALQVAQFYVGLLPEFLVCATPTPTPEPGAPPGGYRWCANENDTVTFDSLVDVAYGVDGSFNYLYAVTGSITFNNATFGDPFYGKVKKGYYRNTGPTPAP